MPAPEYNQVGIPSFNTNFSGINWTGIAPAWDNAIKGLQLGIQSNADADLYRALSGASNYDEMVAARRSEEFQNALKNASTEGRKNAFNFLENMARIDETRALTRGTNLDSDEKERVLQAKQYADAHPDVAMQLRGLAQTAKNRGYYTQQEAKIISNLLADYPGGTTTALDYLFPDVNGTFESRAREDNSKANAQHARAQAGLAHAQKQAIYKKMADEDTIRELTQQAILGANQLGKQFPNDPERAKKALDSRHVQQAIAKMMSYGIPINSYINAAMKGEDLNLDLVADTQVQNARAHLAANGELTDDSRVAKALLARIPPIDRGATPGAQRKFNEKWYKYFGLSPDVDLTGKGQYDINAYVPESTTPSVLSISSDEENQEKPTKKVKSTEEKMQETSDDWYKLKAGDTLKRTIDNINAINSTTGLEKVAMGQSLPSKTKKLLWDSLDKEGFTPKSQRGEDIAEAAEEYSKKTGKSIESLVEKSFGETPSINQMEEDLGRTTREKRYQQYNTPFPFDLSTLRQDSNPPNNFITSQSDNVTNALTQVTNPRRDGYFTPNGQFVSTPPSSDIFSKKPKDAIDLMMEKSIKEGQGINNAVAETQEKNKANKDKMTTAGYYLQQAQKAVKDNEASNSNNTTAISIFNAAMANDLDDLTARNLAYTSDAFYDKQIDQIDEKYSALGASLKDLAQYFTGANQDVTRDFVINKLKNITDNDGKAIDEKALNKLITNATKEYQVPPGVLYSMLQTAMDDPHLINWGARINFCEKELKAIQRVFKNKNAQMDLNEIASLKEQKQEIHDIIVKRGKRYGIIPSYSNRIDPVIAAYEKTEDDEKLLRYLAPEHWYKTRY